VSNEELQLEIDDTALPQRRGDRGPEDISSATVDRLLALETGPGEEPAVAASEQRNADRGVLRSRSKSPVYRCLNAMVEFAESGYIGRVTLASIFALSVALIAFSIGYRTNGIDAHLQLLRQHEQLYSEVAALRRQYASQPLQDVVTRLTAADGRIFTDYRQLAGWLQKQHDSAFDLGLNFEYTLGEAHDMSVKKTVEVPISIAIKANQGARENTYGRALQMLRKLVDARWFVEIVGMTVTAGNSGVDELNTDLRVWVHNDAVSYQEPAE
jgi:hypothetical protein